MPEPIRTFGPTAVPGPTTVPGSTSLPGPMWTDGGWNGDPDAILWTQAVDRGTPGALWCPQPEGAVTGTGGGDRINAHVS